MSIKAWEVYIKCPFCGTIATLYDYYENTSSEREEIFVVLSIGTGTKGIIIKDGPVLECNKFKCNNCGKESLYDDIFTEKYCKVEDLNKYKRSLINGILRTPYHCHKVSFSDWREEWGEEPALTRLIKMYPKDKELLTLKKVYDNIHVYGVQSVTKYEINTDTVSREQFLMPEILGKIYLGNRVKTIAPHTFESCTKLSDVFLPDSITQIGEYAFADSGLRKIHTSKNISVIEKRAFANTYISEFFFPDNIKEIQKECFLNCPYLNKLWIPAGASIGNNAFKGCNGLRKIQVANTVSKNEINSWGLPKKCQIEKYSI